MRTLTIALTAGQVVPLEISGLYFELLSCSYELERIDWTDADGQTVDPWLNVKEGIFGAFPYRAFVIKNGTTAQTIKILIGRGTGGNRAAPVSGTVAISGTVPVSMAQRVGTTGLMEALSMSGATYEKEVRQAFPGAGTYAHLLWNPTGSGRKIIVKKTRVDVSATASVQTLRLFKLFGYIATPVGSTVSSLGAGSAQSFGKWTDNAGGASPFGFTGAGIVDAWNTSAPVSDRAYGDRAIESIALAEGEAVALSLIVQAACNVSIGLGWVEV
jgi:hypothetical protein